MGNLTIGFKKFLQNKNTVTVVGVIAAIIVLYFAYTMRINSAISPVTVPFAKEQINSSEQITQSKISTREVPPSMLEGEVITKKGDIIDKYVAADTIIPEGSLFYKRAVVEKEQLPASIILEYPKGHVLYNLAVNMKTSYGNSIYPGNYIDIYLKAVNKINENEPLTEDADKIMLGKLLANIKVLAVKDAAGQPVFQNLDEKRVPAMVIFALPEEYNILLKKAEFMRTYDTTLIVVPTNEGIEDGNPADLELSSDQLKEWINKNTVWTED